MSDDVTVTGQPHDRLTGLCAEMTTVLDQPENADVKAIVFLNDGKRGGIQTHGYDDTTAALVELLLHLQAMFQSQGQSLKLMNEDGVFLL